MRILRTSRRSRGANGVKRAVLIGAAAAAAVVIFSVVQPPAPKRIFLESGTSWTVPPDWNNAHNAIEAIGGGGAGGETTGAAGGHAKSTNVVLRPGAAVAYRIGVGGSADNGRNGGDTYFCNSMANCSGISDAAVRVGARGGPGSRPAAAPLHAKTSGTPGVIVVTYTPAR